MIEWALLLDFSILVGCIVVMVRLRGFSFLHPGTIYLIFHVLTVTLRLATLSLGAPMMFDDPVFRNAGFAPVTEDEIFRAAMFADISLFISTIGFLIASDVHTRNERWGNKTQPTKTKLINPNQYLQILWVTFFVGIGGLIVNSFIPGNETRIIDTLAIGEWRSSSWVFFTQTWVGVALIGFIYFYGFRRIFMLLMIAYLLLQFYQGFHRFRILLPIIVLANIYLLRNDLRWPRRWMIVVGIIVLLLFFPAKRIGRLLQDGAGFSEVVTTTSDYLINLPTLSMSDLVALDQLAVSLTLVDDAERFYYGTGYLPLITLPIPRPLWPNKPELAFYMDEIETRERPLGRLGTILTYIGEAYINFGIIGVVAIPYLLSYFLGKFYYRIRNLPYNSIMKLLYAILIASLVQVYRDGLTSLVVFTIVNYIPITIITILHYVFNPTFSTVTPQMATPGNHFTFVNEKHAHVTDQEKY